MRIISGKFKKQKLILPDPKITRPLRDYVKESLFNLLAHSPLLQFQFEKSSILDVFSEFVQFVSTLSFIAISI